MSISLLNRKKFLKLMVSTTIQFIFYAGNIAISLYRSKHNFVINYLISKYLLLHKLNRGGYTIFKARIVDSLLLQEPLLLAHEIEWSRNFITQNIEVKKFNYQFNVNIPIISVPPSS